MALGRREDILVRLMEILEAVQGYSAVARNRGDMDQNRRPALVLLDGDETSNLNGSGRGRVKMSPAIVTMRPQVFILLKTTRPQNEDVGTDLNTRRGVIISAIADDAALITLLGPNGGIAYEGCETDLKSGGSLEGQMRLDFALTTTLNPYAN